jgi:predicted DNA binding CopG/RHH family protein
MKGVSVLKIDSLIAWEIPHACVLSYDILRPMQQPITSTPSPNASSFAGMLAALTSPAPRPAPAWNDDDLEDDVATLSYERALRAHARTRSSGLTDQSLTEAAWGTTRFEEPAQTAAAPVEQATDGFAANSKFPETVVNAEAEPGNQRSALFERNLKDASITIRMSKAECKQLHRRAAEAGLTVSAYLRSCTFEAESLRAMVKETLNQLRLATTQKQPRRSWFRAVANWLARLLTPWHGSQRVARA